MNAYTLVQSKLSEGMTEGNMHACRRDVGRLAGGLAASGAIDSVDMAALATAAVQRSKTPVKAEKEWQEAVAFGGRAPIEWDAGYERPTRDWGKSGAMGWNDVLPAHPSEIDLDWLQPDLVEGNVENWAPADELRKYLTTLFELDDIVGYVTESQIRPGSDKATPAAKGSYTKPVRKVLESLAKYGDDLGATVGDSNPDVGAWIRFNPLDGKGVKDANVADFRYALIESDTMSVEMQSAALRKLELPIAALVHSGGKSLHAIVKVEAHDLAQYRERVDYLYTVCARNGLEMDRQNKNPSRLSRMPGVMRAGNQQRLLDTNIGLPSWDKWREHIEDMNDDLPDIETLTLGDEEPELAPELITGILREGHKMLLSGPSKAGKSFALQQLAIAVADGGTWLGWQIAAAGKVLYVNLEVDRLSATHRFWKIYQALGRKTSRKIDVWHLRGHATTMDKLAPKLIRRAKDADYKMVIIDPIYKVLTGDENSASEMSHFCNQFDRICNTLGVATVCCHHHSKGEQGGKSAQDRGSGSGVFSRDPDAIIDLIELQLDEARRKKIRDQWACPAMFDAVLEMVELQPDTCPQDERDQADKVVAWANAQSAQAGQIAADVSARTQIAVDQASAWRIEGTLREFAAFPPRCVFFRYPVHIPDGENILKDAKAAGEVPPWELKEQNRLAAAKERNKAERVEFDAAYDALNNFDGLGPGAHKSDIASHIGGVDRTIERRAKKYKADYALNVGRVIRLSKETVEDA